MFPRPRYGRPVTQQRKPDPRTPLQLGMPSSGNFRRKPLPVTYEVSDMPALNDAQGYGAGELPAYTGPRTPLEPGYPPSGNFRRRPLPVTYEVSDMPALNDAQQRRPGPRTPLEPGYPPSGNFRRRPLPVLYEVSDMPALNDAQGYGAGELPAYTGPVATLPAYQPPQTPAIYGHPVATFAPPPTTRTLGRAVMFRPAVVRTYGRPVNGR